MDLFFPNINYIDVLVMLEVSTYNLNYVLELNTIKRLNACQY